MRQLSMALGLLGVAFWLAPGSGRGQDKDKVTKDKDAKVVRQVTPEKLESVLKGMAIEFKKTAGKKDGIHFYDYERNKFKIRLHNYNGADLWVDAIFTDKSSLEEVNAWNVRAKFSRAVLLKEGDKQSISLECQLDCRMGVTDGMIRQFVNRFDDEIKNFVKFLSK